MRYSKMFIAWFLIFSASCGAYAAEKNIAGPTAKATFEKFESPAGKFSVLVPAHWRPRSSFPYQIDDTVSGVFLEGPVDGDGAAVKIAILHYAGAGKIKGTDHYIRMVGFNPTRLDGTFDTDLSDVEVAGRKGKTFTFTKFELVMLPHDPPESELKPGIIVRRAPPSKQVTMVDRYIVIPSGKGFYSLRYEASKEMYDEYADIFDAVVKSFSLTAK
jgi:hypothetical protein